MCKFSSKDEEKYEIVWTNLQDLVQKCLDAGGLNISEENLTSGRNCDNSEHGTPVLSSEESDSWDNNDNDEDDDDDDNGDNDDDDVSSNASWLRLLLMDSMTPAEWERLSSNTRHAGFNKSAIFGHLISWQGHPPSRLVVRNTFWPASCFQ